MGRYYTGDIEGKFWFAVQSSDAPSRFGAQEYEPNFINYYFDEEQLDEVTKELDIITKNMQGNIERLNDFFAQTNGYNTEMIIDWYKKEYKETINEEKVKGMLVEYADYVLGKEIAECIKEKGECNINAEI